MWLLKSTCIDYKQPTEPARSPGTKTARPGRASSVRAGPSRAAAIVLASRPLGARSRRERVGGSERGGSRRRSVAERLRLARLLARRAERRENVVPRRRSAFPRPASRVGGFEDAARLDVGEFRLGRGERAAEGSGRRVGDDLPPSEAAARVPAAEDRGAESRAGLSGRLRERGAERVPPVENLGDDSDEVRPGVGVPLPDSRRSGRRGVGIAARAVERRSGRLGRLGRLVLDEAPGDKGRELSSDSYLSGLGVPRRRPLSISRRLLPEY